MIMNGKLFLKVAVGLMALMFVSCEKTQTEQPELTPKSNVYSVDGQSGVFESVVVSNIGEYICVAATPSDGVDIFDEIFDQEEYFYIAISPLLNGKEFDMKREERLYTVISTMQGATLESVKPETTQEIQSGTSLFNCKDGKVEVTLDLVLENGSTFSVRLSAEETGIVVNENLFSIGGNDKPVRASFSKLEDGKTALYLTPAGIEYFDELEIATYYAYIILDDSQCHGKTLAVDDVIAVGYVDNFNSLTVDSREVATTGTVNVASSSGDSSHFVVSADLDFAGTSLKIRFEGKTRDADVKQVVESKIIYEGKSFGIKNVMLDSRSSDDGISYVKITTDRDDVITISLPSNFVDGNAHGFSQSSDLYIEYGGVVYSKANGSSGTVMVGVNDGMLKVEATNYKNLEIIYEGSYDELS